MLVIGFRLALLGTSTYWLVPFRLKACPTSPVTKPTPFCRVPMFVPAESKASPSPAHQLTMPEGGATQAPIPRTIKEAPRLDAEPTALLTQTLYIPPAPNEIWFNTNVELVAAFMGVPLKYHW